MIKRLSPYVYIISVLGTVVPVPNSEIYHQFHEKYEFTNYWLRNESIFQNAGQAIFQNVQNPYEISTYYQRNMYDDTYVINDTFFKYTKEYKDKVRELCFVVGNHNLKVKYNSSFRQYSAFILAKISRIVYEIDPEIEMKLAGIFMPNKNQFHNIKNADLRKLK